MLEGNQQNGIEYVQIPDCSNNFVTTFSPLDTATIKLPLALTPRFGILENN